jgi:hypothetical protein
MRFDFSSSLDDINYNAAIDSAYGRRTDDIPKRSLQFSPRLGFNWDATGDRRNQLRGGIGLFVGTPPYIWLENAYVNSGNIITSSTATPTAAPRRRRRSRSIRIRSPPAATVRAPSRSAT